MHKKMGFSMCFHCLNIVLHPLCKPPLCLDTSVNAYCLPEDVLLAGDGILYHTESSVHTCLEAWCAHAFRRRHWQGTLMHKHREIHLWVHSRLLNVLSEWREGCPTCMQQGGRGRGGTAKKENTTPHPGSSCSLPQALMPFLANLGPAEMATAKKNAE